MASHDDIIIRWKTQAGSSSGADPVDVIRVVAARLAVLDAHLPCQENCSAMKYLWEAVGYLTWRTEERRKQGVEGTLRPHDSNPGSDDE